MKKKTMTQAVVGLIPLLVSAAMTVRFSPVILGAAFAVTSLITLVLPAYRNRRSLWMFLFTFLFSIPLNVKLIVFLSEYVPGSPVSRVFAYAVICFVLVCIEELISGIIFKILVVALYKKSNKQNVGRMTENVNSRKNAC